MWGFPAPDYVYFSCAFQNWGHNHKRGSKTYLHQLWTRPELKLHWSPNLHQPLCWPADKWHFESLEMSISSEPVSSSTRKVCLHPSPSAQSPRENLHTPFFLVDRALILVISAVMWSRKWPPPSPPGVNPGWSDAGGSNLLLATKWFQQACDLILNNQIVGRLLGPLGKIFLTYKTETHEGKMPCFCLMSSWHMVPRTASPVTWPQRLPCDHQHSEVGSFEAGQHQGLWWCCGISELTDPELLHFQTSVLPGWRLKFNAYKT